MLGDIGGCSRLDRVTHYGASRLRVRVCISISGMYACGKNRWLTERESHVVVSFGGLTRDLFHAGCLDVGGSCKGDDACVLCVCWFGLRSTPMCAKTRTASCILFVDRHLSTLPLPLQLFTMPSPARVSLIHRTIFPLSPAHPPPHPVAPFPPVYPGRFCQKYGRS